MSKKTNLKCLLIRLQLSRVYPVIFAILCTISGLYDKYVYIPILSVLTLSIIFSAFCVKDNRVFLAPIFMIYYALGTDKKGAYGASNGDMLASFDPDAQVFLVIIGILIAAALITRFILDGSFKYAFTHRSGMFWGIIAIDAVLILNGIFSPYWSFEGLMNGVVMAGLLTLFATVLYSIISRSDENISEYVCFIMMLVSYIVFVQILSSAAYAMMYGRLFAYDGPNGHWIIIRSCFQRSWGIATIVGGVSVLGIPAALYLARDKKYPIFYYISALLFMLVSFIINTRSAMLAGVLCLLAGVIIICFSGRNRRINRIFTLSFFGILLIGAISACTFLGLWGYVRDILLMLLRLENIAPRFEMLINGFTDMLSNPVFGVGLLKGNALTDAQYDNMFSNMYHNVVIQFAASMGIVGFAAFMLHLKDVFVITFKRAKAGRTLLMLLPFMILLMSLVDNFFFYLNFQIFYIAFLSLSERESKKS